MTNPIPGFEFNPEQMKTIMEAAAEMQRLNDVAQKIEAIVERAGSIEIWKTVDSSDSSVVIWNVVATQIHTAVVVAHESTLLGALDAVIVRLNEEGA